LKFLSLHINTEPTWRGGEQQTLYLLEGLRRRGYPVALVAAPGSPLYVRACAEGIETYGVSIRSEADVLAICHVARILRQLRPRLIHLHTSHAHTIGVCASMLARSRVKRVVSRRVNFSIYRHSFFGLNWVKYCYGVDQYLAVSSSVRDVLIREGVDPDLVRVVYSGVDPKRFEPEEGRAGRADLLKEWDLPEDVPLIGSVGALEPYKGFLQFVEAAAEVFRRRPCSFVIVGEGELRGELMRRIRELGLDQCFRLVGFRRDIGRILAALDLFVFPSLEEGLGTSLLDALLLQRPTIATRVGGIPEVISDDEEGLLVEAGDVPALVRSMERILADPDEGRELATRGREKVLKRFHVDKMVGETLDCYRDLLDDGVARTASPTSRSMPSVTGASLAPPPRHRNY
jgi:glycosyltransferase involved in cell wall biosynthesis